MHGDVDVAEFVADFLHARSATSPVAHLRTFAGHDGVRGCHDGQMDGTEVRSSRSLLGSGSDGGLPSGMWQIEIGVEAGQSWAELHPPRMSVSE